MIIRDFDFLSFADMYLLTAQLTIGQEIRGYKDLEDATEKLIKEYGPERFGNFRAHLKKVGDISRPPEKEKTDGI